MKKERAKDIDFVAESVTRDQLFNHSVDKAKGLLEEVEEYTKVVVSNFGRREIEDESWRYEKTKEQLAEERKTEHENYLRSDYASSYHRIMEVIEEEVVLPDTLPRVSRKSRKSLKNQQNPRQE